MLLSFEHVTFGYTGVPIVKDVSFSVHEKERVGFLGGNGEGKTTILKLLTGELTPSLPEGLRMLSPELSRYPDPRLPDHIHIRRFYIRTFS